MNILNRALCLLCVLSLGCATGPKPLPVAGPGQEPYLDVVPPSEAWRATQPGPGPAPTVLTPTYEQAILPNGLTVIVHERRTLPLVAIQLTVKVGSAAEASTQAGLASLTYEFMLEGAGSRDAIALADAFADLGTEASTGVRRGGGNFDTQVLTRNTEAALALLADVLQRPTLLSADFDRKRKERLADLERLFATPDHLATVAFDAAIFGAEHPYGHPMLGTPQSVAALTVADAQGFYRRFVGPANVALVMAGDVSLEQAVEFATRHFGNWKADEQAPPAIPEVAATPRTEVVLVPKPGLEQTLLYAGRPAVPVGHPDQWALALATYVFGGSFSARLNMNLREDKSATYGSYGWLDALIGVGYIQAQAPVQADKTGIAVRELVAEWGGLISRPITEVEHTDAVEGQVRAVPGWFESIGGIAGTAGWLYRQGQPLDWFDRMIAAYRASTLEQVRDAATRYFDPSLVRIVLVGDPEVVRTQVGPLELGPIQSP